MEIGLNYNDARYDDSGTGRFPQSDSPGVPSQGSTCFEAIAQQSLSGLGLGKTTDNLKRNGATVGTYRYNALGQLSALQLRSGVHMLANYGTSNRDYVWLGDLPVATVDNTNSGSVTSSTINYVVADQLATPRAVTNSAGTVVWSWAYQGNPFGELQPTSSGYALNLRYPGQWYDAETGTSDNGYRTFESYLGRYAQTDPTGLDGGISTFAYVGNNPLIGVDPMGLQVIPVPEYRPVPIPIPDMPAPRHSFPNLDPAVGCLLMGTACIVPAAMAMSHPSDVPSPVCKPAKPDAEPNDLCEQLALAEAKAGAGRPIMGAMADEPRLVAHYGPGPWAKIQHTHTCPDGRLIVIHYFSNGRGLNVELKIVGEN